MVTDIGFCDYFNLATHLSISLGHNSGILLEGDDFVDCATDVQQRNSRIG